MGTLIALPHAGSSSPRAEESSGYGSPLPDPSSTRVFVGRRVS
ncbi:hypothetical protein [Nonomuraea sp. NPDC059022]